MKRSARKANTALGEVQLYGTMTATAIAHRLASERWEGEGDPYLVYKSMDLTFDPKRDPYQVVVTIKFQQGCTLSQLTVVIRLSPGSADWKSTYAAEAIWPGIGRSSSRHVGFVDRDSKGNIVLPNQGSGGTAEAAA